VCFSQSASRPFLAVSSGGEAAVLPFVLITLLLRIEMAATNN
jgi:hypothetical protein